MVFEMMFNLPAIQFFMPNNPFSFRDQLATPTFWLKVTLLRPGILDPSRIFIDLTPRQGRRYLSHSLRHAYYSDM